MTQPRVLYAIVCDIPYPPVYDTPGVEDLDIFTDEEGRTFVRGCVDLNHARRWHAQLTRRSAGRQWRIISFLEMPGTYFEESPTYPPDKAG